MTTPNLEQLTAAQQANTEILMSLMRTGMVGFERLTALNIAASREFFNTAVATTQQLMTAKDASNLSAINSTLAQPNLEKWMDYSRSVYDLVSEIQKEVTGTIESQYSSFNKHATAAIEKTSASTPVGGEIFAAAMKSVLNATSSAFDNMTAIAKQMGEITESNIKAGAAKTAAKPASATAAAARKK
jgi:phasin family protein